MSIEITNVQIFDGIKLTNHKSVVIENGFISHKTKGDSVMDGEGGTLLPGLIDAHVHLDAVSDLEDAVKYGVTTMLDMAARSTEFVNGLKNRPGLTDILTCYTAALYPIDDPKSFVADQVNKGADYIKIIIEDPPMMAAKALAPETITALTEAAHEHKLLVFAHAATLATFQTAIDAGVDIITHVPVNAPVTESMIKEILKKGIIAVPTTVMMEKTVAVLKNRIPGLDSQNIDITLRAFMKAGIPVIAGTDANHAPHAPASIDHGIGLLDEIKTFVGAGMTPVQALQSATSLPAKLFGFKDRGIIKPGHRADLLLVDGDPTADIQAIRKVKRVWVKGIETK
jgi:imidazolonepropionase-like amidohydrolase